MRRDGREVARWLRNLVAPGSNPGGSTRLSRNNLGQVIHSHLSSNFDPDFPWILLLDYGLLTFA